MDIIRHVFITKNIMHDRENVRDIATVYSVSDNAELFNIR